MASHPNKTRPCTLSSILKQENVECIKQTNQTTKKAKKEKSQIRIPNLGYSDASFANLTDSRSQGGYIIFLIGSNSRYMPTAWQSKRIKRVIKSNLGAEPLAMVDLTEACLYHRKLILDLLQLEDHPPIKIMCKTDNSCLYDAVHSTTPILDKRLWTEMEILREMIDRRKISETAWISTERQIADALTKKGVLTFKILGLTSELKGSSI